MQPKSTSAVQRDRPTQTATISDANVHIHDGGYWRSLRGYVLVSPYRCPRCSVVYPAGTPVTRWKPGQYLCAKCRPQHPSPWGNDGFCAAAAVAECDQCQIMQAEWLRHCEKHAAGTERATERADMLARVEETQLLTIREAASICDLGYNDIYRLILGQRLRAVRIGPDEYRIPVDAVLQFAHLTVDHWESHRHREVQLLRETLDLLLARVDRLEDQVIALGKSYGGKRAPLNLQIRQQVISRDASRCRYCGKRVPKHLIHVDHIVPVALGGRTVVDNLAVACQRCNHAKGAKSLVEARMQLLPVPGGSDQAS